jgi:hypothetical protein
MTLTGVSPMEGMIDKNIRKQAIKMHNASTPAIKNKKMFGRSKNACRLKALEKSDGTCPTF